MTWISYIGANVCKQCISPLKQLATVADQYFIAQQLSDYFKKIIAKKIKNEQNFKVTHGNMKNITQTQEYLVTLAVSTQLSVSRNSKNFNKTGLIKYCFCIINSRPRNVKRKQAYNADIKHLVQYL